MQLVTVVGIGVKIIRCPAIGAEEICVSAELVNPVRLTTCRMASQNFDRIAFLQYLAAVIGVVIFDDGDVARQALRVDNDVTLNGSAIDIGDIGIHLVGDFVIGYGDADRDCDPGAAESATDRGSRGSCFDGCAVRRVQLDAVGIQNVRRVAVAIAIDKRLDVGANPVFVVDTSTGRTDRGATTGCNRH